MSRERPRKLSIFIDGGHYNATQRYYQISFDFLKFMKNARERLTDEIGPIDIVHTFYYDCEPYTDSESTDEQKKALAKKRAYLNFLRARAVRVREGTLVRRITEGQITYQQKRVDLLLGLDIAEECNKGLISHLVLVAGDSDLVPTAEFASHRGVQVWLLHGPRDICSDALWAVADGRIEIDENFARLISKNLTKECNNVDSL